MKLKPVFIIFSQQRFSYKRLVKGKKGKATPVTDREGP
jgi:hypothetical protein